MKTLFTAAVAATLIAGILGVPAEAVAPSPGLADRSWRPAAQAERSVPGRDLVPRAKPADPAAASIQRAPSVVSWPAAGAADVSPGGAMVRAGGLPVWIGGTGGELAAGVDRPGRKVRVRVFDQSTAAGVGVAGLLLAVESAHDAAGTGRIAVQVDYSSFRWAYGGDWASRLRLVQLPGCALSAPQRSDCRGGRILPGRNDLQRGRVDATVDLDGAAGQTVLAVTAANSGSAGDYKATSLSASSSWSAGGSAGDFTWSYPLDGPPALGGPDPDLSVRYSSGSVDGRTAGKNNQTSWLGEGWALSAGFIERRYKSCADDVTFSPKPGDLCWETDNAFLSLGNSTLELVRDDATGAWHPRTDDGSRVEHLTGATNGDNDGEYWKITAVDGTQYFYGLNRLPGWVSGNEVTNSAWTAPVFGNDSGEPCHGASFASSYCSQAWRWNLDYVVDPHGNAMSLFYTTETNYYGRNLTATAGTAYVRGGYLARVDYGQRSGSMYSAPAPMQVQFVTEERCAAGATCGTGSITSATASNWPDVPYDLDCAAGAGCTDKYSPTFWSRRRLASVTTRVWRSGTTYQDVDSWAFGYQFRDPGDGTAKSLWLASITHSGKVGGTKTMPAVTFEGVQLENRVDAQEGIPPMYKWRLTDVYTEAGGHVRVNYSVKECTRAAAPTPDTNTKRCFPQYWTPEGALSPQLDWFHKYLAVQVLQDDVAGVAGIEQIDYEFLDGGAWHWDDNELTPAKYRTWSQWRGYTTVRTTHGSPGEMRSQSEALFMRGMDGDKLSSGTRSASVTDSEGVAVTDHPALAGLTRESITYTGVGGTVLSGTINDAWISAATATHGSTSSYLIGIAKSRERQALAGGGWRRTETQNSFDAYGLPTQVNDLGDTSTTADDRCTRTSYARNTGAWLIAYESREETVGVACTVAASYPSDAITDTRAFYDGSTTFGAAPAKGDKTLTQEIASYTAGTPNYVQTSRASYDSYGRILSKYDELDRLTTTAYTPATGPVTSTVVTNPLGYTVTTTMEPAWGGKPTVVLDANNKRTDLTYDALGRLTAVWLPDRAKSANESANMKFSYLVQTTAPSVITSETVRDDGTYAPSYAFFDGRLRGRQTQTPAPDGGRVISGDTFYDSRGLLVKSSNPYWNSGTAGTTLLNVPDNTVPGQSVSVYDGAERQIANIFLSYGTEKWHTTTGYGGDRVDVTPPGGGTATTTITDADDRVTELRQYTSGLPTGTYDATTYSYTKAGQLKTVTDPAGNVWSYGYDVRGRKSTDGDPDKGVTTYTYDNADQLLTSTDARGVTLAYKYDTLGRKTELHDGSLTGPMRAQWTYDTLASGVVVKGQRASSTRYDNGNAYTVAVNGYDSRYRPLGTTVTIPSIPGGNTIESKAAGSYKINTGYTKIGLPLLTSYPAAGDLAAETLRYGYDSFGRLMTAQTGLSTLLTAATYSPFGEPLQQTLEATPGKQVVQTSSYEDGTRRLSETLVDRNVSPLHLADVKYTYDAVGNITKITDTPAGGAADTQCFGYDYVRRLTQAWTATVNCDAAPSPAILGGPAPYWQSWTYDAASNRRTETNYNTTTGAGITSTYNYPAPGSPRPHALASRTTGAVTDSYDYDATGNTTTRTIAGAGQSITWDAEGRAATMTKTGQTTSFLYDADGNRLIRRDPDAETLSIGGTELKVTKATGAVSTTRYYAAGKTGAVRTSAGLWFQTSDIQGTSNLSINAADLSADQRRYLPFGKPRGTTPANWAGEKGYVGGTVDTSTGLTHLGAREYDADSGRFISVDPLIDINNPQQMSPYAYSDNSPITMSDPDGMGRLLPGGHYCDGCEDRPTTSKPSGGNKKKSDPASHHYCDGCDYSRPVSSSSNGNTAAAHHFCDGCDYMRKQAEARRVAAEYAAKKRRQDLILRMREALRREIKKYQRCYETYGRDEGNACSLVTTLKDLNSYVHRSDFPALIKAASIGLFKHTTASASFCVLICFEAGFQNGELDVGIPRQANSPLPEVGLGDPSWSIGFAARTGDHEDYSHSISVGRYSVSVGANEDGIAWSDWSISIGPKDPKASKGSASVFGGSFPLFSVCLFGGCN